MINQEKSKSPDIRGVDSRLTLTKQIKMFYILAKSTLNSKTKNMPTLFCRSL